MARVFLPWEFINQTRGLFGNWSFDTLDEFTLPNGNLANGLNYNPNDTSKNSNWKGMDEKFASQCKGNCQNNPVSSLHVIATIISTIMIRALSHHLKAKSSIIISIIIIKNIIIMIVYIIIINIM